jgi:hypothetical protein
VVRNVVCIRPEFNGAANINKMAQGHVLEVGYNEKILLVQGIDLEINVHDVPD